MYNKVFLLIILFVINFPDLPAQITKILASDPNKSWAYGNAVNISGGFAAILGSDTHDANDFYTIEVLKRIDKKWFLNFKISENYILPLYVWGNLGSYLKNGKLVYYKYQYYGLTATNKLMIYDIGKKLLDSIVSLPNEQIESFGYNGNWLVIRKSRNEFGNNRINIIDNFYKYVDNKIILTDSIIFQYDDILSHPNTSIINISDNFTIIGFDRDDQYGLDEGSVRIYKRYGENWVLFQNLVHHDPHPQFNSRFGIATAISEDERFLVAGAIFSNDKKGKVYIYELHGDKFELFQTINEPADKTKLQFGNAISFKNNILLIGHSETKDNSFRGKVYYYTFKDNLWQLKYTVQPPLSDTKYKNFGISVDQDGETFIAGADADETYHWLAGAAYIFQIPARDTITTSACKNEGYAFGDTTYYESGTYRDTLIASYGVDSVVVLKLTVLPVYNKKLDTVLCKGQSVKIGDQVFDQSGQFTVKFISAAGCDSIIDLTLRVIEREYPALDTFFCSGASLSLQGQDITTEGTYSFALHNINGCDSIITYNVRQIDPDKVDIDTSYCEGKSINIKGNEISEPGTYNFELKNRYGCDSIISYIVKELPERKEIIDTIICEGESIIIAGNKLNQTGHYNFTLVSSSGCDSLIELDLKIALKNNKAIDTVLCDGQSIRIGDQIIEDSGVYDIALVNQHGCDSLINIKIEKSALEVKEEILSDLGCRSGSIGIDVIGNNPPFEYLWNNGSTNKDLTGIEKGKYTVVVSDKTGCSYEFSFETDDSTAYLIPEAFIPDDSEELNKIFRVFMADQYRENPRVSIVSTNIFDRWGQKVFSSTGSDFWDGTFRSHPAPAGVYLYSLVIETPCGLKTENGQVLLLR